MWVWASEEYIVTTELWRSGRNKDTLNPDLRFASVVPSRTNPHPVRSLSASAVDHSFNNICKLRKNYMELLAHLSTSIRIVRSDPMFILSPCFINSGVLQSVAAETMFLSVGCPSKGRCTIHIPLIADWRAIANEDFYISSCNNWIIDHPGPCILLTAAPPGQSELDISPAFKREFWLRSYRMRTIGLSFLRTHNARDYCS